MSLESFLKVVAAASLEFWANWNCMFPALAPFVKESPEDASVVVPFVTSLPKVTADVFPDVHKFP